MKKNRIAALAVTGMVASLVVGSLVIGSNMGFKKNQLLILGQDQWIAVPMTGPHAVDANSLLTALGGAGGTVTNILPTAPPSVQFWTGSLGDNFAFVPGNGYQFRPGVAAATSVIIVGAHDPNQIVPAGGFLGGRDYLLSPPYHTTAVNAQGLLDDIPGGGTITRLVVGPVPSFQFWTGSLGDNFAYTIGEGVTIRPIVSSAGFLPSHF